MKTKYHDHGYGCGFNYNKRTASEKPYQRLPYNLSFFADGEGGEKTEKATPKKKEKAREEGQVAKSAEIGTAVLFIVLFNCLRAFAPFIYGRIQMAFYTAFDKASNLSEITDTKYAADFVFYMFLQTILAAAPMLLVAMGVGIIVNLLQVGWHPTTKPLKPKLNKLNPISGVKRMFSFRALLEFFKSLLKFGIIVIVIYNTLKDEVNNLPMLMNLTFMEAVIYIGDLMISLGVTVGVWFIFIAVLDYSYQRFKHNKDLKMSKHEVKEEYKQAEGNPQIKGKIRQKMQEASMRRMMHSVPGADVVITNPTHYAVAIKYDKDSGSAPIVVAKGADFVAKRIREMAKENNVQIVENKQLARALYATVDIGREIPPELYQTVAEILAFVYKLKNLA